MKWLLVAVSVVLCLGVRAQAVEYDPQGYPESALLIDYNPSPNAVHLRAVATVSDLDRAYVFVVGNQGHFRMLQTNGPNLVEVRRATLADGYSFTGVAFADKNRGWVAGYKQTGQFGDLKYEGILLRTTNGGTTWINYTPALKQWLPWAFRQRTPFLDVWCDQNDKVWVSCGNGYVFKSSDPQHMTWTMYRLDNEDNWIWHIAAVSYDDAWFAGDHGTKAWHYQNGNWLVRAIGKEDKVLTDLAVRPWNSDDVVMTLTDDNYLHTTDGGQNWIAEYITEVQEGEWWQAACYGADRYHFAGTRGVRKVLGFFGRAHQTPQYDLEDVEHFECPGYVWDVAVGSQSTILAWYGIFGIPGSELYIQDFWCGKDPGNGKTYVARVRIYRRGNPTDVRIVAWRSPTCFDFWNPEFFQPVWDTCLRVTEGLNSFDWIGPLPDPPHQGEDFYYLMTLYGQPHYASPDVRGVCEDGPPTPCPTDIVRTDPYDNGRSYLLDWTPVNVDWYLLGEGLGLNDLGDGPWEYLPGQWVKTMPFRGKLAAKLPGTAGHYEFSNPCRLDPGHVFSANVTLICVKNGGSNDPGRWYRGYRAGDEAQPPPCSLTGRYDSNADKVVLEWRTLTPDGERASFVLEGDVSDRLGICDERNQVVLPIQSSWRGRSPLFRLDYRDPAWNWRQTNDVRVNVPRYPPIAVDGTSPNNGRMLAVDPQNGRIHLVYGTGDSVGYAFSESKGDTWSIFTVDAGAYPALVLDNGGFPRIAYLRNDTVLCQVLTADSAWKTITVFAGDEFVKPGPPVIAAAFPAFEAGNTYVAFPCASLGDSSSTIKFAVFDTSASYGGFLEDLAAGTLQEPVSEPSLAVTPGDILHIAYNQNGEVFYRQHTGDEWSEPVNVSLSAGVSEHPCIEAFGDNVLVAWKEGEPGEIYRRVRSLSSPVGSEPWSSMENISQTSDQESDYPVLSSPDVVAYQESVDSVDYEIIAWIRGDRVNISETQEASKYPHIAVEAPTATSDEFGGATMSPTTVINAIWTETVVPDSAYQVSFRRYEHAPTSTTPASPYLSATIGDSTASVYCAQRDGAAQYGEVTCDYSQAGLIYELPYFDPRANYLLRAVVYKEGSGTWRERMYVDTTLVSEVAYRPSVPETVSVILPRETYENDLAIRKEIERIVGSHALLADLKVYQVSASDQGEGGGQQSAGTLIQPVLYACRPNPFAGRTAISYQFPFAGRVLLRVYDVAGRSVRTLQNGPQNPGRYTVTWDGRDDRGRRVSSGIYFYRLDTPDFRDTMKAVMTR